MIYLFWFIVLYPSLLSLVWLAVLAWQPRLLLAVTNELSTYQAPLPSWLGGDRLTFSHLALAHYFLGRDALLDAWLEDHLEAARENFETNATMADRANHVDLAIMIEKTRIASAMGANFLPIFANNRGAVVITGPDGSGKTSLAGRIARWGMSADPELRIASHAMAPVYLQEGIDFDENSSGDELITTIRGKFDALVGGDKKDRETLFDHLLRRSRVLVIVDHAADIHENTRAEFMPPAGDPFRAASVVMITTEPEAADADQHRVKPLPVTLANISNFIATYLKGEGKENLLEEREQLEACIGLSSLVGRGPITPTIARLYADQLIASKEGRLKGDLPRNVPDLMENSLALEADGIAGAKPKAEDLTTGAERLAWQCVRVQCRPSSVESENLDPQINGSGGVDFFTANLGLLESCGPDGAKRRLAEPGRGQYLAALHLITINGADERAWNRFFGQIDQIERRGAGVDEFLRIVRECCRARFAEAGVPVDVISQMDRRVDADRQSRLKAGMSKLATKIPESARRLRQAPEEEAEHRADEGEPEAVPAAIEAEPESVEKETAPEPVKRPATKKAAAKPATAKKTTAKKTAPKKAPAKKQPVKKTTAKKKAAPKKKSPPKKAAPAKKKPAPKKKASKRAPAKKKAAKKKKAARR